MGITYVSWVAPVSAMGDFHCVTAIDPSNAASMPDIDPGPYYIIDRAADAKYDDHAYTVPGDHEGLILREVKLGKQSLVDGYLDGNYAYMQSENSELPFDTCGSSTLIICVATAFIPESYVEAFFEYVTSGVTYRLDLHRKQLITTISGDASAAGTFQPEDEYDPEDGYYVPDIPEIGDVPGVVTAIFDVSKATIAAGQLRIRINGVDKELTDVSNYTGSPFTLDKGQVRFGRFRCAPIYSMLVGTDIPSLAAYEQWCADRIGMDL